jgi:hypothetical protein
VRFGVRKPSLQKSIAARTSGARIFRHSAGFKAPRGGGWVTSPKRFSYNWCYHRSSTGVGGLFSALPALFIIYLIFEYWVWIVWFVIILLVVLLFVILAASRYKIVYPDEKLYIGKPTIPHTTAKITESAKSEQTKRANEDYQTWSYQKLKRWKSAQENKMALGDVRPRPTDIKLWTQDEINDWKIEEWLELLEVRRSAKQSEKEV